MNDPNGYRVGGWLIVFGVLGLGLTFSSIQSGNRRFERDSILVDQLSAIVDSLAAERQLPEADTLALDQQIAGRQEGLASAIYHFGYSQTVRGDNGGWTRPRQIVSLLSFFLFIVGLTSAGFAKKKQKESNS